ncbi:MAG: (d)CMP kinase [Azospirillaceae bacterium]
MIIAVDGTAASGKGTLARRLARHYGLPHLDTGALYRAVALACLRAGADIADEAAAAEIARIFDPVLTDDAAIRSDTVGEVASRVSVHPSVRQALLERQRAFARQPGGAVLDGRDIGTVVCPEAAVKLFVDAPLAVRAQRRYAELSEAGYRTTFEDVAADMRRRDERDRGRAAAPLARAPDAVLIDTELLTPDGVFQRALAAVEAARARGG